MEHEISYQIIIFKVTVWLQDCEIIRTYIKYYKYIHPNIYLCLCIFWFHHLWISWRSYFIVKYSIHIPICIVAVSGSVVTCSTIICLLPLVYIRPICYTWFIMSRKNSWKRFSIQIFNAAEIYTDFVKHYGDTAPPVDKLER